MEKTKAVPTANMTTVTLTFHDQTSPMAAVLKKFQTNSPVMTRLQLNCLTILPIMILIYEDDWPRGQ